MITINATIFIKENEIEKYKSLSEMLIQGTRSEPGNLKYDMYQSVEVLGEFMFVEQYLDQNALEQHRTSKHFTEFSSQVEPLLSKKIDVRVLQDLPRSS